MFPNFKCLEFSIYYKLVKTVSNVGLLMQVELGFGNGLVDDIFFISGYDIRGSVTAQVRFLRHL